MEPPSSRRLRRSSPPPQHGAGDPDGHDRISALSDDMLLQVLVRLRCARAAARTGLLSCRWRGLWARLPGLTFGDITAAGIKSAFARIAPRTAVSLLEIRPSASTSCAESKLEDARAKSLMRAAALLSPEEIVFVLPQCTFPNPGRGVTIVLPSFRRATSIELDTCFLRIKPPPAGELPVLEMLSISGNIVGLGALLERCPRLRVLKITFRGVESRSLEAELAVLAAAATLGLAVSRLGIEFDDIGRMRSVNGARFASLLRAVARVSTQELLFTSRLTGPFDADLPYFYRTMSIEMKLYAVRFKQLPDGEFSVLERMSLCGCTITDLATMIMRCPRLRVLKVTADKFARDVTVHSVSLEDLELHVKDADMEFESINIVTPLLKKVMLKVHGKTDLGVSISAPMVEKVSWYRTYASLPIIFDFWWLQGVRLSMIESYKNIDGVLINEEEGVCSHLPRVHVLSLDIAYYNRPGVALDLASELEKLLVTDFSVFEVHLNTKGHVFGAFMLRLLTMHRIRTSTQKLKIFLPEWFQMPQASKCLGNCPPCDEPNTWRSQSISLTLLEDVEINNFTGGDHEIDFLRLIFGWAPMLKRMTIKLVYKVKTSKIEGFAMTIYNICMVHPSVNCSIYLSSDYHDTPPPKGSTTAINATHS
ncbi:unnamed protein product [Alopecurus aequalis]